MHYNSSSRDQPRQPRYCSEFLEYENPAIEKRAAVKSRTLNTSEPRLSPHHQQHNNHRDSASPSTPLTFGSSPNFNTLMEGPSHSRDNLFTNDNGGLPAQSSGHNLNKTMHPSSSLIRGSSNSAEDNKKKVSSSNRNNDAHVQDKATRNLQGTSSDSHSTYGQERRSNSYRADIDGNRFQNRDIEKRINAESRWSRDAPHKPPAVERSQERSMTKSLHTGPRSASHHPQNISTSIEPERSGNSSNDSSQKFRVQPIKLIATKGSQYYSAIINDGGKNSNNKDKEPQQIKPNQQQFNSKERSKSKELDSNRPSTSSLNKGSALEKRKSDAVPLPASKKSDNDKAARSSEKERHSASSHPEKFRGSSSNKNPQEYIKIAKPPAPPQTSSQPTKLPPKFPQELGGMKLQSKEKQQGKQKESHPSSQKTILSNKTHESQKNKETSVRIGVQQPPKEFPSTSKKSATKDDQEKPKQKVSQSLQIPQNKNSLYSTQANSQKDRVNSQPSGPQTQLKTSEKTKHPFQPPRQVGTESSTLNKSAAQNPSKKSKISSSDTLPISAKPSTSGKVSEKARSSSSSKHSNATTNLQASKKSINSSSDKLAAKNPSKSSISTTSKQNPQSSNASSSSKHHPISIFSTFSRSTITVSQDQAKSSTPNKTSSATSSTAPTTKISKSSMKRKAPDSNKDSVLPVSSSSSKLTVSTSNEPLSKKPKSSNSSTTPIKDSPASKKTRFESPNKAISTTSSNPPSSTKISSTSEPSTSSASNLPSSAPNLSPLSEERLCSSSTENLYPQDEPRKRCRKNDSDGNATTASENAEAKKARLLRDKKRTVSEVLKMANKFNMLLVETVEPTQPIVDEIYSPPPLWNIKDFVSPSEDEEDDTSFDGVLPQAKGPCDSISNTQNVAFEIHCLNRIIRCIKDRKTKIKVIKSFVDLKTDCSIFFLIHAQDFQPGNESMLARVSMQRFVMMLRNALKLYELEEIPENFYGKVKAGAKKWRIPKKNVYGYDTDGYVEFNRAGTCKHLAAFYTEFTRAEINILLDAHLLCYRIGELTNEEKKEKYITQHSNQIFEWINIIKERAKTSKHVHHSFIGWCDLVLPIKDANSVLSIMKIMFKSEFNAITESLKQEFQKEKITPENHTRYYQAALKGLKCTDLGMEKFYGRDDNLWYTTFVGTFFNDICEIQDGDVKAIQPYIKLFRYCIDGTKNVLQEEYGNFQNILSDTAFWDAFFQGNCQSSPRAYDLYKNLATFVTELSLENSEAFDFNTQLIKPLNEGVREKIRALPLIESECELPLKEETNAFIGSAVADIMMHFFPALKKLDHVEHSAAIQLFSIFVLKGLLMEWEKYNMWSNEIKEQGNDNPKNGLSDLPVEKYFGKPFLELPANIMAAVWNKKYRKKFFSAKVPISIRKLLMMPHFKLLTADGIDKILQFYGKLDKSYIVLNGLSLPHAICNGDEIENMQVDEVDVQVLKQQPNSDSKVHAANILALGKPGPARFRASRLTNWAMDNAKSDLEEKGANFVLPPILCQKSRKNDIAKEQSESRKCQFPDLNSKHPLLSSVSPKLQQDFPQLFPEMQKWSIQFISVLNDILYEKNVGDENDASDDIFVVSDQNTYITSVEESLSHDSSISSENGICNDMQMQRRSVSAANTSFERSISSNVPSPFPVVAVCSEKESVIYSISDNLVKYISCENGKKLIVPKDCEIWDYCQGKKSVLTNNIVLFLCEMWVKTSDYSKSHKRAGTLKNFLDAQKVISDIQNGKEIPVDEFLKKVVGVRFPFDLRKDLNLKNFCTVYIPMESLNYLPFKFHFDIAISAKNRISFPYHIVET